MKKEELVAALEDAVAILDMVNRNAEAIQKAFLKAGMDELAFPGVSYEMKERRIRAALKKAKA